MVYGVFHQSQSNLAVGVYYLKIQGPVKGGYSVTLEDNKANFRGLYEEYNKHNVALLDKFLTPDYVHHA